MTNALELNRAGMPREGKRQGLTHPAVARRPTSRRLRDAEALTWARHLYKTRLFGFECRKQVVTFIRLSFRGLWNFHTH